MHASTPDPHIYDYVRGSLKGYDHGEVIAQAREFESDMIAWNREMDTRELTEEEEFEMEMDSSLHEFEKEVK